MLAMKRLCLVALLGLIAASGGCSLCQNCDDYNGSYYGGKVGDWDGQCGRAGSVYAGNSTHDAVEADTEYAD